MQVCHTVAEIRQALAAAKRPVGLVPTMGYLHAGHLALVKQARRDNETVVVSIFVNPTQFGPNEDLAEYPRDMKRDLGLLEKEEVDLVFAPEVDEIYPPDFSTSVQVERVTEQLEGASRPGHFRGVATVVTKLFNIVQPDRAYFGQKDAQQLRVIRKMVHDLNLPVDIRAVPIVRENDGLAMSSRNVRLSPSEREAALVLSRALRAAEALYEDGAREAQRLRDAMRAELAREPLAKPDYVSVADLDTLRELDTIDRRALVSLAVRVGPVRLIDNVTLG
ncbi:MAG TPA: pantoate--beta-alanine ligase [Chloroflexota bacterium]|nr:pantoate--beta-alanine ligase [Chloroflexota bacterium]